MLVCNRQDPKAGAGVSDKMKQTIDEQPTSHSTKPTVDLGQTEMQKPGNINAEPLTHHLTSLRDNPSDGEQNQCTQIFVTAVTMIVKILTLTYPEVFTRLSNMKIQQQAATSKMILMSGPNKVICT